MPHRGTVGVVLTLRPARHGHILGHHRGHRPQPLAHVGHDLAARHAYRLRHGEHARGSIDRLVILFTAVPPAWWCLCTDAQHLAQGKSQAGDRHLKNHETRDNLTRRGRSTKHDATRAHDTIMVMDDDPSSGGKRSWLSRRTSTSNRLPPVRQVDH